MFLCFCIFCKQTFPISKVCISEIVKGIIMQNLRYIDFLYEDGCSHLHKCTFKNTALKLRCCDSLNTSEVFYFVKEYS